ncbi:Ger(x)C family spore germination protein [Brevibacillus formosus]|uniref:Ger(x)C family spore germination protein n=1 Tax=Brevibacillus formosus TaxID=54913 RepID=UPI0018CDDDA6|nr:Ger(x)C family spore germination protein [Brevibacillus formosus]MBG9943065.1 spore gernimation protein [Brevibacillus formosus]
MKRTRLLAYYLLVAALLHGCGEEQVLEKLGLAVAVGYDQIGDGRLLGTTVFYQIDPEARQLVTVIAGTANTSKGLKITHNRESSKKIVGGQIRVAVYQDELARKGILPLVENLSRDASIGSNVYLTVAKGRASDILTHRYPETSNIGIYLYQAIRQNVNGENMISSKLHEFMKDYYAVGKDPVMPYIERVKNELHIDKIALFRDERLVGDISTREGFFLKILRERYNKGELEINLTVDNQRFFTVIEHISSKKQIKLLDLDKPKFSVKVKMTAQIQEMAEQIDLSKPEELHKVQKAIQLAVKKETEGLLEKLGKHQVDPVGFGEIYNIARQKSGKKKLNRDECREAMKRAQFDVDVQVKILRTGVIG